MAEYTREQKNEWQRAYRLLPDVQAKTRAYSAVRYRSDPDSREKSRLSARAAKAAESPEKRAARLQAEAEARSLVKQNDPELYEARRAKANARYRDDPAYREKVKAQSSIDRLRIRYGMTPEMLQEMATRQGGKCGLPHCGRDLVFGRPSRQQGAHIDHCHQTGRVRGILCGGCNTALGRLGDTVESLEQVVKYLKGEHNG